MIKTITFAVTYALLFVPLGVLADNAGLVEELGFEATETYIQFFPQDGYVKIREYGLSTLLEGESEIHNQVEALKEDIANAQFCKKRFGLSLFTAMQENVYVQKVLDDIVSHVDCNLVTIAKMPASMKNAFSSVLNRNVEVSLEGRAVRILISGPNLSIRTNNATNIIKSGDAFVLTWEQEERFYEIVIGADNRILSSFNPIGSLFDQNISSPAKSQEEVQAWRDSQ